MNKYCSHCGYANAGNAVRCENCKLFVGISEKDKDIKSFSGTRLIGILVVIGFLTFAGYKTFIESPPPKPQPFLYSMPPEVREKMAREERERMERQRNILPR